MNDFSNSSSHKRKICFATIAAMLIMMLTACSGLPTSGDVKVAKRAEQRVGEVVLDPKGPAKKATAEQVISGFLRAASVGLTDDFKAARQFLTKEMAAKWNPLSVVRVYPDSQTYSSSQTPSGAFRVSVSVVGSLNTDGLYSATNQDSQVAAEFSLIRNADGEWRIAVLDDGVMMSNSLFRSLYVEAPLYFPSSYGKNLVADVRWYPRHRLAGSIARGIVKGPSKWVASAVRTVLPPEISIIGAQVRESDSVAVVELSADAAALSMEIISILQAQYRQSFSKAGVAQDVVLNVSGVQISGNTAEDLSTYPLLSSPLVALRGDGAIVHVSQKTQHINEVISADVTKNLGLNNLTLSYDRELRWGAALGADKKNLHRIDFAKRALSNLLTGSALIPPSIDSFGWVWSGESASTGELVAIELSTGRVIKVKAPELAGVSIKFVKVSREGARAVLVYEREGKLTLGAVALTRSVSGEPQQIGELLRFERMFTDVQDLVWVDESNLVLLGRVASADNLSLLKVQIGGPAESFNTLDEPIGLAAIKGKNSIVLADKSGAFYEYTSGAWRKFAEDLFWPATAG